MTSYDDLLAAVDASTLARRVDLLARARWARDAALSGYLGTEGRHLEDFRAILAEDALLDQRMVLVAFGAAARSYVTRLVESLVMDLPLSVRAVYPKSKLF